MKTLLLCLLLVPAALRAQTVTITPFVASDESMPGDPVAVGASVALRSGLLGVRAGGSTLTDAQAWSADADLILALAGSRGWLGGLTPVAFVGIGARGERFGSAARQTLPTWSYGGDVAYRLASGLSFETGARHRRAIPVPTTSDFAGGWEYRVGLAFHFGGKREPTYAARTKSSRSLLARTVSTAPSAARSSNALGHAVIATGEEYLGVRYRYGGESPRAGFDCSGFVQYVFRQHGIALPRTSRQQAVVGIDLPASIASLAAGDLMFFAQSGRITHVAMYAGGGRILHATSSGGEVRYDDLDSQRGRWFATHFVEARRVTAGADWTQLVPAFVGFDAGDSAPRQN